MLSLLSLGKYWVLEALGGAAVVDSLGKDGSDSLSLWASSVMAKKDRLFNKNSHFPIGNYPKNSFL